MRNSILIVDDIEVNRDILAEMLEDDYNILQAENGLQALEILEKHSDEIILVLLDLVMPVMDGYEVLKVFRSRGYLDKIPVLVISAENSIYSERECFTEGATDFIRKPFDATLVRARVKNVSDLYLYKEMLEIKVDNQTEIIRRWNTNIIDLLGDVVESRNLESGQHIQRVKGYTEILANEVMKEYPEYDLDERKVSVIVSASSLHDVGKISIPDYILLKPGKLTEEEFEKMKLHTVFGGDFIANVTDMWDDEYGNVSYDIARHHHEKYDGKGYPDHLSGDDIPISAQIVSIADVYDALVSKRCYKDAYGKQKAADMIVGGECGMFNPKLMTCFKNVQRKFEELADSI